MFQNNFKGNGTVIQVNHVTNIYINQPSPDKLPDKPIPKKKLIDWSKFMTGLHSIVKWIWKFVLIFIPIDSS